MSDTAGLLGAFASSFAAVGLAELGDKTQLVVVALAARGRPWAVGLGAASAFALLGLPAVALGAAAARWVDGGAFRLGVAALFLVLGLGLLLGRERAEARDDREGPGEARGAFGRAFLWVLLAEVGDKTQLATVALAGSRSPVGVYAGATAALASLSVAAALIGNRLTGRMSPRLARRAAGVLFLVFAVLELAGAAEG